MFFQPVTGVTGSVFDKVVNVHVNNAKKQRQLGPHTIVDVYCNKCQNLVGCQFIEVFKDDPVARKDMVMLHMWKLQERNRNQIEEAAEPGANANQIEEAAEPGPNANQTEEAVEPELNANQIEEAAEPGPNANQTEEAVEPELNANQIDAAVGPGASAATGKPVLKKYKSINAIIKNSR
ncbi:uncharacterized protein LOC132052828 [Lycium ferocissimum]|uniref:uncharacterized protein LOC132052828 n=1 Tax=Lycium ferocissimum TaxID=112874 RepID=UPI002815AC9B|nr:uncharacterized protein LOC132052828 [Lycium ferocissimum]